MPEDVYTRAYQFYTDCGLAQSVTFSTSSGLPNPLERHGSHWYLDHYEVDPDNEAVADLLLKNPFRMSNFAMGILNTQVLCKRLYVWELHGTSKALRKAYAAVPDDKKDLFVTDAIDELAQCFAVPQLRILEVPTFDSWMTRLTRNAPNSIMVSFRGPISKRISHAVNLNFASAEEIDSIYKQVLLFAPIIGGAVFPSMAMGVLWVAAIGVETAVYEQLKRRVFGRGVNLQSARIDGVNEIKPYGGMTSKKAINDAEATIHRLLTL